MSSSLTHRSTTSKPESPTIPETKDIKDGADVSSNSSSTIFSQQAEGDPNSDYAETRKEFNELASQFGSSVLLSTFIATLMITFLAFANIMIHDPTSVTFQAGMVLCCMAATCHVSLVLVAGRAGTQAYRNSRLPRSQPFPPIEEYQSKFDAFSRCLRLCEDVQALGTTIFSVALLFMCWYIFHTHLFAYVLFVFVIFICVWIYAGGFWEISWAGVQARKARLYINQCTTLV